MKIFLPLFFLTNTTSAVWFFYAYMSESDHCPSGLRDHGRRVDIPNDYLLHEGQGDKSGCIELGFEGDDIFCKSDCIKRGSPDNKPNDPDKPCKKNPPEFNLPNEVVIGRSTECQIFLHEKRGQGGMRDSAPGCGPTAEVVENPDNPSKMWTEGQTIGKEHWTVQMSTKYGVFPRQAWKNMYLQCLTV
ncbi:MAG: hypothetical protein L6R35_003499 [Caloplaca aegaea]|nr:MAG: hypothetical protein L6R35_003499 [Caloplaca aegaea]